MTHPGRRRPTPIRPGDRGGPLVATDRGPVRLRIVLPTPGAELPWIRTLEARGWHVHRIGAAMYAHDPERPDLPGWLVGFSYAGVDDPSWIRWLRIARTDPSRPRARRALEELA